MVTAVSGNKRILWLFIVLLLLGAVWWFWKQSTGRAAVELPDDARISIKIERLDLDLKKTDSIDALRVQELKQAYGEIFKAYVENAVALSGVNDPELYVELNNFLRDPYIDTLFRDVAARFSDLSAFEQELSSALSYYYYFFPKAGRVRVASMISGFQYKHALSDSGLLLGLDLHLGRAYAFYPKVSYLTEYMLPRLEPGHLVADGIKLMVDDLVPPAEGNQLLDEMVRAGKILYITKSCMPELADSILLGFTSKQTSWAFDSERSMWEYLIAQNLLFSSDVKVISRMMNDGPFTAGLPDGSPARMATFSGWRMVHRFMDKNKEVSLEQLLATPSAEILKNSGYKGKS